MYLKRIEIYGFKSFADRIELDFDQGITAVVGPNGSGKSNIADAIKWVLGEQKVKSLRGSKMEDVIFAGTIARKPLGYAEVTLVLNNEGGALDLEYEEISVTRRLYRSGESEYKINKTPCRLKDVQELFADTGLGKEGYSIIGQGKIDSIVSSSTQDIRHLFDEAAGIVKFKNRKLESERKLERTVDNLHRVTDIVAELEKQLGPLQRQRKKAQIYLEHAEDLKKIQLNIFVNRTEQIQNALQDLYQQRKEGTAQQDVKKQQIEDTDQAYQTVRREITQLEEEIDEINRLMLDLSQRSQRSNTDMQVSVANIANARDRIHQHEEEKVRILKKQEEVSREREALQKDLHAAQAQWEALQEVIELKTALWKEAEDRRTQYLERRKQEEKEQQDRQDWLQRRAQDLALLEKELEHGARREQELLEGMDAVQVELRGILQKRDEALMEKSTLEEVLQQVEKEATQIREAQATLSLQRKQMLDRQSLLGNNLSSERSKLHMLEEDQDGKGYYRSVKNLLSHKETLKELEKGIRDIAGNLIQVEPKYALAVETALGGSFQHLVVEDDDAAKVCIRLLNERKWGRATFLPLTAVNGTLESLKAPWNTMKGVLGLATDLISFEPVYEGVFAQLLGKTLIVEDLQTGLTVNRTHGYKGKIVTLQGEVFQPGGAIVGGTFNRNNLLLQRNNHIQSLKDSIATLQKEMAELSGALEVLEGTWAKGEVDLHQIQNRLQETKTELRLVDQKLAGYQEEESTLRRKQEGSQQDRRTLQGRMEEQRTSMNSMREEEEQKKRLWSQEAADRPDEENEEFEILRNTLNDERNGLNVEAAKLEANLQAMEQQLRGILDALEETDKQNLRQEQGIVYWNGQIAQWEEENRNRGEFLGEAELEIQTQKHQLQDKLDVRKEKNRRFDYLEKELKGLNHEHMLLSDSLGKLEVKINGLEMEKQHLAENIFEDYQMTYLMALEYRYPVENMELEMRNAKALKDKIKGLGNINLAAIQQYEEVRDRHQFLTEQREDLLKAREELKGLIKEISKDIEVQFIEQFSLIQTAFNTTFKQLFNGGNAGLLIVDDEDIMDTGIEIVAQPPGKKLKNITLLSGGEKSLTAIALLFAIIGIKPAPFCVLDEIDAALDDSNVDRFAHFLSQLNKENQFITITHRKGTMETADRLYGVTMGRDGVSKMVSVQLSDIV